MKARRSIIKMDGRFRLLYITLTNLWVLSRCAILGVASSNSSVPSLAKPNCQSHCGDVEIPYPFGIGPNCSVQPHPQMYSRFKILCDQSTNPPKPFLNLMDSRPELLKISLEEGTLQILSPITFFECQNKPNDTQPPNLAQSPFWFSDKNKFTSVSCGRTAFLTAGVEETTAAVCLSICETKRSILVNNSCDGINCCQTTISNLDLYDALNTSFGDLQLNAIGDLQSDTINDNRTCKYAFLADQDWFTSKQTNTSTIAEKDYVPVQLEWRFWGENYTEEDIVVRTCRSTDGPCSCQRGYQGNPYLPGGCQDINECEDQKNICGSGTCLNSNGSFRCNYLNPDPLPPVQLALIVVGSVFALVSIIIGAWGLRKVLKKRRSTKRKQKFFRQNGGLLLEKQLSSGEVNVEKIKLFNAKELENATDRFNKHRVIGQGGQGTVYKGMLTDGKIVAVKKSKIVDGEEVKQFINEIVILSQLNHRNVVKLLGCCLESQVPLLIYEFLPNGTLSQYIHGRSDEDLPLTWEMRLRVSIEVAGALSYLHSYVSMPIYHRDIKSSNILMDDKHRAKVADFGTSRSVAIDQTHLTMTHVNGTFGYLDPEYFQSSQFTDKSDVYSFGVVLAELLTGQKPISVTRSQDGRQEGRSLATHFIAAMEENSLFDILDAQVTKEGKNEDIMAVANLTKRCLNMKGKKRPSMKEIATELEGIQLSIKSSVVEQTIAEVDHVQPEIAEAWDVGSTSTWTSFVDAGSLTDVEPLVFSKSY